jgi:hypothetical protein
MPGINFRFPYGFDQPVSDPPPAGGLLGLIQQIIQQQGLDQGAASESGANAISDRNPDSAVRPSGGVLGPVLAMQAGQYQTPMGASSRPASSPLSDPNFGHASQALGQNTGPSWPTTAPQQQLVPAQWGGGVLPRPVPIPPIGPMPPGVPLPPIPIPKPAIPDAWRALWAILQIYPSAMSRLRRGGGDREDCYERESTETARCWANKEDYAHPDYLWGCIQRAKDRRNLCVKNGGKPNPSEPPEWGPADEETWRNYDR